MKENNPLAAELTDLAALMIEGAKIIQDREDQEKARTLEWERNRRIDIEIWLNEVRHLVPQVLWPMVSWYNSERNRTLWIDFEDRPFFPICIYFRRDATNAHPNPDGWYVSGCNVLLGDDDFKSYDTIAEAVYQSSQIWQQRAKNKK